jgi:hypothetical protein
MIEQPIVGYLDDQGGKLVRHGEAQFTGPLWRFKD